MIHEVRNYVGLAQSKNEIAIVGNPSIHTQNAGATDMDSDMNVTCDREQASWFSASGAPCVQ